MTPGIHAEIDLLHRLRTPAVESTLSDDYFDREFNRGNDEFKQPQRERVLEFLYRNHPRRARSVKFFGFPGAEWRFEKMLHDKFTIPSRFIGIERSWQVLEYGIRHMPGRQRIYTEWPMKHGKIRGFASESALIVNFRAEQFWGLTRTWKANKDEFARLFKRWTCAWIDCWYPVRDEFRESLRRIGGSFSMDFGECPIAVSFPIGRDECPAGEGEETLESRVRVIDEEMNKSHFRTFYPVDSFQYKRPGRAMAFGTVLGLMRQRSRSEINQKLSEIP